MKKALVYVAGRLPILMILLVPVYAHTQTMEDLGCKKGLNTVPLQVEAPIPSLRPRGSITYCSEYAGEFKVYVSLKGLKPRHPYVLCLNGKENGQGNDILKTRERYGNEGVYTFGSFQTDDAGFKDGIFKIPDLSPSVYDVKFLVKDGKSFSVPLKNDFVFFTINEPLPTTLTIPKKVSMKQLVKGKLSDPNKYVYIFIHPLTTEVWWVQNIPAAINLDGSWYTMCYFGTETLGIGEPYEIVAIVSSQDDLFKGGAQISVDKMRKYLKEYPHSEINVVERPK